MKDISKILPGNPNLHKKAPKKNFPLKAKKPTVKSSKIIRTFDTETVGLGGYVNAAALCFEDGAVDLFSCDEKGELGEFAIISDMVKAMFESNRKNVLWYAHNLAYDFRAIERALSKSDYAFHFSMRTDDKFWRVVIWKMEDGKVTKEFIELRDSMALFGGTLDEFAKSFGEIPKLKEAINFSEEEFNPENPEHVQYLINDVKSLQSALVGMEKVSLEHYGVALGATAAGTAMQAWRATLNAKDKFWKHSKTMDEFFRKCYFGGMVGLSSNKQYPDGNVVTFDRNSSYPASMEKHGVPDGYTKRVLSYVKGKPGFYVVDVEAPDEVAFPLIYSRDERGRPVLKSGSYRGYCTSLEYEFALAHGYKLRVVEGVVFSNRIFPFSPFISKCRKEREEFKGEPRELLAKLYQNSLYGKFGAKTLRRACFQKICDEDLEVSECFPIGDDGYYHTLVESEDMFVRPDWAAWITAASRVALYEMIYDVFGADSVLYVDTDSVTAAVSDDAIKEIREHASELFAGVYTPKTIKVPVSNQYGDWKLEKIWNKFRAVAPKVYAGEALTKKGVRWMGAAKGIPSKAQTSSKFEYIYETGEGFGVASSIGGFFASLKSKKWRANIMLRRLTKLENSVHFEQRQGSYILS